MSNRVFILGGARTPMTTHVGALKDVSAIELGAIAAKRRSSRTATKAEWIDRGRLRQRAAEQH
jgi:acetyl-CoA acetyltransferase